MWKLPGRSLKAWILKVEPKWVASCFFVLALPSPVCFSTYFSCANSIWILVSILKKGNGAIKSKHTPCFQNGDECNGRNAPHKWDGAVLPWRLLLERSLYQLDLKANCGWKFCFSVAIKRQKHICIIPHFSFFPSIPNSMLFFLFFFFFQHLFLENIRPRNNLGMSLVCLYGKKCQICWRHRVSKQWWRSLFVELFTNTNSFTP